MAMQLDSLQYPTFLTVVRLRKPERPGSPQGTLICSRILAGQSSTCAAAALGSELGCGVFMACAARFATCSEVERHSERVEDMLSGWDVALLKDGVKYGPRYG